jgi:YtkA-like
MRRISIPQARRGLQVVLGVVWLVDAALQFQPFMFGRGFANEILKPTAEGNPHLVAQPVLWSAHLVLQHPVFWNTTFALTQLLLALGLFWRRSVKFALVGTVVWSLVVWWLGEGLGGVFAGSAAPLMGSPGAVILYALLALLLWPAADAGGSLAETSIIRRAAPLAWLLLWGSQAYFALLPANDSPNALHGMFADMADGEPQPIAALDRLLARLVAHHSVFGPGFGALFAVCALAVLVPPRLAKPLYGLAMVLAVITWVGQDFGEILTGQGTDVNSGPLLFLLALAYWPIRPRPAQAPATATERRRPLMQGGVAAAAAALVAASSVAAATGITSQAATAAAKQTRLTISGHRIVGPGPVLSEYHLAGYRVLFRDPVNRATHPGVVSVELQRRGRPVEDAQVTVTYRSLDMRMPSHTLSLLAHTQGRYSRTAPTLGMGGRWRITISISRGHAQALLVSLTDLISR